MERMEAINKYYIDLDYDKTNITDALAEIKNLLEKKIFEKNVTYIRKLEKLSCIIQKNLALFVSIYKHIDVITAIIQSLYNLERFKIDIAQLTYNMEIKSGVPILKLLKICKDTRADTLMDYILQILKFPAIFKTNTNSEHICEMIILKDSDLYAIINCLKITENYPLYKIWVEMPIMEKFLWLTKKYNNLDSSVHTFQSLKDIKLCTSNNFSIVSIWTENIIAAKNFALSLNKHVVFINSYMEFSGGVISHNDVQNKETFMFNIICEKISNLDLTESKNEIDLSSTSETSSFSINYLFYDGMWQKPIQNTYWKHNDILWANATNSDIVRCYESAKKGFEIWSAKSVKSRIEILSNLESMLNSAGKPVLAAIIVRCRNLEKICLKVTGFTSVIAKVEMMHNRIPLGVIILKEKNENILFIRLLQTLITGNTVIVINDVNSCNLLPYCEMFTTCGIPAGVINLLSCENINVLENRLCSGQYSDYIKAFFDKSTTTSGQSYIKSYKNLTMSKQIVIPSK